MGNSKERIWKDWIGQQISTHIPLFAKETHLKPKCESVNGSRILRRSNKATKLLASEARIVQDNPRLYDGLIYLVYTTSNSTIEPVYIGKSTSLCTTDIDSMGEYSAIPERWSHNGGHLKKLSKYLNHKSCASNIEQKYEKWGNAIFSTDRRTLKQDVYIWIKAWDSQTSGPYTPYIDVYPTLEELEYQLIGLAYTLYPEYLVNREGVPKNPKAYAKMREWIPSEFRRLDDFV
jgi:hypothetical protein